MPNQTIAVIGLGNMGGPMAANLVAAGYTVQGFDVVPAAQEAAKTAGVQVRTNVGEAVTGADVILTMLPNGALVNQVINEAVEALTQPALFIDSSTIAVEEAKTNATLAEAHGHRYIDAPVSGGVVGAAAGTLAFMVGGAKEDIAKASPLFDVMGRNVTHCGDVGAGEAAKLCNNMILGVQQIVIAEAMVLGERLGLSAQAFYDVVSNSTGACWALTVNCPVPGVVAASPSNHDFQPGFATDLIVKDLGLAMQAAESTGTETQMGAQAAERYQQLAQAGYGAKDFGVIIAAVRSNHQ
ncbi:3-hydroxyisobutyrate dehydrogenase [Corynebacterium freiburgense]|uniref:3-hydroxyisobutyrate dehydrogenase n=1 Tax=Corynebacterium freiburgense TaxID=556548 RepID=UPI000421AD01|nr:3-hydroxyisobutyrate dehydrogenase [Corynebacterium freiburgense]WJZ02314.1 3-hydroxyisobutyrate dehydrogenase [Corynebacterium freiburgense]